MQVLGMGKVCAVCVEEVEDSAAIRLPGCGHVFHASCALAFAQYDVRCPVCRRVPEGVAPRGEREGGSEGEEGRGEHVVVVQWEDVVRAAREEEEERRAEWRRYCARRRRLLNREPSLHAMFEDLKRSRARIETSLAAANRIHARLSREAWRNDPAVRVHRDDAARERRREGRLARTLHAALHARLGSEPRGE